MESIRQMVGSDVRRVGMNVIPPSVRDDRYRDGFGMILRRSRPHLYYDTVFHPLAEAEIGDLAEMALPLADDPVLYTGLKERAKQLYEETSYAVLQILEYRVSLKPLKNCGDMNSCTATCCRNRIFCLHCGIACWNYKSASSEIISLWLHRL